MRIQNQVKNVYQTISTVKFTNATEESTALTSRNGLDTFIHATDKWSVTENGKIAAHEADGYLRRTTIR